MTMLTYEELDSDRLLSPKLLGTLAAPAGGRFPNTLSGNPAIGLFDDFEGFGFTGAISSTAAWAQSNGITYKAYIDGDAGVNANPGIMSAVPTTTPAVDLNGPGVIQIQPDDDAADDTILAAGESLMMPFNAISATAKDLVFETRFKINDITASETDFFIGLGGTGACANTGVLSDTTGTLSSNNFLGFGRWDAETNLRFGYQRAGGTQGEVDDCHTLVADTYLKAGFRYNADTKTCGLYINGALVNTVTKAATIATPWPTLFMNFITSVKFQATTNHVLYIDWWAGAQYI